MPGPRPAANDERRKQLAARAWPGVLENRNRTPDVVQATVGERWRGAVPRESGKTATSQPGTWWR
jgi:hypothetical protein